MSRGDIGSQWTRHEYRIGPEWIVYKEYFANGPSLFNWIAERKSWGLPHVREEFARKRDAVAWVKEQQRRVR